MSGLTVGHDYLVQWWSNNSSDASAASTTALGDGDVAGVSLRFNSTAVDGGLGEFATGTFTATGTSRDILFEGIGRDPLINAMQLRDVTAIPEPAVGALILGGSMALLAGTWRRSRTVSK